MPDAAAPASASPRHPLRWLLLASLALNLLVFAAAGAWCWRKGGTRYLLEQLGLARTVHVAGDWEIDWRARNASLPNLAGEVIFLGDSITAATPWSEYFSRVRNRGIGGDTADGVLQRLDEVTESQPKQVFLCIGTNDLAKQTPVEQVVDDVAEIVRRIHADSPETRVYVSSVLPINLEVADDAEKSLKHQRIPQVNKGLLGLADALNFEYIDLHPTFSDANGYLKREWTTDGLHLNTDGKHAFARALTPYVQTEAAAELAEQTRSIATDE